MRCFPRWLAALDHLRWPALVRLAARRAGRPQRPRRVEQPRRSTPHAILRRHGITGVDADRPDARGDRAPDRRPGGRRPRRPAWTGRASPSRRATLDAALARAHARLPIDLDDPGVWCRRADQRARARPPARARPAARPTTSRAGRSRSRDAFDADDLRCWRIASATWLRARRRAAAGRSSASSGRSACSSCPPRAGDGWQLTPVLSLDAIRAARRARRRRSSATCARATLPADAVDELLERVERAHAARRAARERLDSAGQLAEALTARARRSRVSPGVPRDPRDRWGRLLVRRRSLHRPRRHRARRARAARRHASRRARFPRRRLGSAPLRRAPRAPTARSMELGEAVQTAIEHGLPLLLSTEAAGELKDTVRVGRMKGRPGLLTITTADGGRAPPRAASSPSRRSPSCARSSAPARTVTLDAGARQLVRMVRARPLADDPVLLGRQREMAALKVVGSGVDASPDRHRQDDHHRPRARPPRRHHAAAARRCRRRGPAARPVARRARCAARPAAGCRRWRPTSTCSSLADHGPIAGQIRALRPRARRPARRRAGGQRRARPPPGRAAGDRLAPADRRRGAALRQPGHRGPPGARAAALRPRSPTAGC